MNEFAPQTLNEHEKEQGSFEHLPVPENSTHIQEKRSEQPVGPATDQLESIRNSIERTAVSQEETPIKGPETQASETNPWYVHQGLKVRSLTRNLSQIQASLPPSDRTLSKVIHQPAVKAASEILASTVARPSGLLGGSICAFLGSSVFFYLASHIGFRYNYTLVGIFFVGGFAAGLFLEFIVKLLTVRSRKRPDNT